MTDKFVLIGHPVGHSVSPAIHRAAYEVLGKKGHYEVRDAPDAAAVRAIIDEIRAGVLSGANVTVPHKQLALSLADEIAPSAQRVGAANVLARDAKGRVVAHNTDAQALADELIACRAKVDFAGRNGCLVLGAGGAALATVLSCQLAGFSDVVVTARRFSLDLPRSEWPGGASLLSLGAELVPWSAFLGRGLPDIHELACVVQATSAGMKGTAGGEEVASLLPWSRLPTLIAYDLVYNPPVTPFLRSAKESGHFARGGLGMLVGQAALAIEIWWGTRPPLAPLEEAAKHALGLGPV